MPTCYRQSTGAPLLSHLPNPYDIPNSTLSISFTSKSIDLPHHDAVLCLTRSEERARERLRDHELNPWSDLYLPLYPKWSTQSVAVQFAIARESNLPREVLTYEDAITISSIFFYKLKLDGWYALSAVISSSEDGTRIGSAAIDEVHE